MVLADAPGNAGGRHKLYQRRMDYSFFFLYARGEIRGEIW